MAQEVIWAGSSSFSSGDTPWGLYDTDNEFTSSADIFADWSARRLGYPIMSVELQSGSFYACFEEAVTEYSAQVNQFNIKDNLLHLTGQATGSNVTHKRVTPTMGRSIFLSKQYGTEAGVGGDVSYYTGSLAIKEGVSQKTVYIELDKVKPSSRILLRDKCQVESKITLNEYCKTIS